MGCGRSKKAASQVVEPVPENISSDEWDSEFDSERDFPQEYESSLDGEDPVFKRIQEIDAEDLTSEVDKSQIDIQIVNDSNPEDSSALESAISSIEIIRQPSNRSENKLEDVTNHERLLQPKLPSPKNEDSLTTNLLAKVGESGTFFNTPSVTFEPEVKPSLPPLSLLPGMDGESSVESEQSEPRYAFEKVSPEPERKMSDRQITPESTIEQKPFEPVFEIEASSPEDSEDDAVSDYPPSVEYIPDYVDVTSLRNNFNSKLERDKKDPRMISIKVAFVLDGPDGLGRRLYEFYVFRSSGSIGDLKWQINNDFGYNMDQQWLYYQNKQLKNHLLVSKLPDFDSQLSILLLGVLSLPEKPPQVHLRPRIKELSIEDYQKLNWSEFARIGDKPYLTDENLNWPPYRDWMSILSQYYEKIRHYSSQITSPEALQLLVQEESMLQILLNDFESTCLHVVHCINRWQPEAITDLGNLFGDGGDKWIAGGLLVRKVKDWNILGESIGEGPFANSIANAELQGLNLLRGKIESLDVPLSCIVDYYGVFYFCSALLPITHGSLAYGSNTDGIFVFNYEEAELLASQIGRQLCLKPHNVTEIHSKRQSPLTLPFTVELHIAATDEPKYFLQHTARLMPPFIESDAEEDTKLENQLSRRLRPELLQTFFGDKVESNFQKFTWKNPVKCGECEKYIEEHDYYYYDKKNVDVSSTKLLEYYCCLDCYDSQRRGETLKVPINKLQRMTLPEKDQDVYWMNVETGESSYIPPSSKASLNPDAFLPGHGTKEDRDEIIRVSIKLQERIIPQFVNELTNLTIMPLDGRQLTNEMHKRGIGMSFLGKIAVMGKHNFTRELAVREVLTRTIKMLIRDGLSFLVEDSVGFSHEEIKKCILHYFNEIFTLEERASSLQTWEFITEHARSKFNITLEKDILKKTHLLGLLHRLWASLHITLTRYTGFDFTQSFPFELEDISEVHMSCKLKRDTSHALEQLLEDARSTDLDGRRSKWYYSGGDDRETSTMIFRKAIETATQIFGTNSETLAETEKEIAEHLESRHQEIGRPEYSKWNPCASVPDDEISSEARAYYEKAIKSFEASRSPYWPEVADWYLGLAKLTKYKPPQRDMNIYHDFQEPDDEANPVLSHLQRASEIMEISAGVDHPETAELYLKLALAYQEYGLPEMASAWVRRAFCIFYSTFGPEEEIVQFTFEYLKKIEIHMTSGLENVPLLMLQEEIERIEFHE